MAKAQWRHYTLLFRQPAITSRNTLTVKDTWFLQLTDSHGRQSLGEASMFPGLSAEGQGIDSIQSFETALVDWCKQAETSGAIPASPISAIRFGYESALLRAKAARGEFSNGWLCGSAGIPINGLVWMGDKRTMASRIRGKLDGGFRCVKLKIGGIRFEDELDLLRSIRREFSSADIELRLDANGAFTPANALERLNRLAQFEIHSIEQPIPAGNPGEMARICTLSPIPVALDEELIGMHTDGQKEVLLDTIRPHYIILKPSLCGGFEEADRWISLAEGRNIGWWATSALESNIGLEAIAIWASTHHTSMPQGLGTGGLYLNNLMSPLYLEGDLLKCRNRNFIQQMP